MRSWRALATCGAIAFSLAVPALHARLLSGLGAELGYAVAASWLLLGTVAAVLTWPGAAPAAPAAGSRTRRRVAIGLGFLAAGAIVFAAATALLPIVFGGPVDVVRGDMLVITEAGVRRFLDGGTPYAMYQVPWDTTLSYGPVLWAPFVLPIVLHADMRILTLVCFGAAGAALVVLAALAAARREWIGSAAVALLAIALMAQPDIRGFYPTGHTFVYWPLLLLLAVALAVDRWLLAAVVLGLLVAGRTTMIAMVPVFVVAAHHQRALNWRLLAALALAALGPFLPFIAVDPQSVQYSMYGAYQKTIKGFVWSQTQWVQQTIGVTGSLLRHGLQRYVEPVQIVSLLAVYALAWRALRRGARVEPWMALALLVFCMTTLWPVTYLYFDVWVFLIGAFACRISPPPRRLAAIAAAGAIVFGIAAAATLAAGSALRGTYDLDVGTAAAAPMTGGGFGQDKSELDEARTLVWVEGTTARVRAPHAGISAATITIDLKPAGDGTPPRQQMRVSLNGHAVGTPVTLEPGWQVVSFPVPANRWTYGFNLLTMEFSRTVPEPGTDRPLSAAIDRIRIR